VKRKKMAKGNGDVLLMRAQQPERSVATAATSRYGSW